MPRPPTLPPSYHALLDALAPLPVADDGRVWLGDAGFRLAEAARTPAALAQTRWPGMDTDLLPFAVDGFGNRYCFWISPQTAERDDHPVVYWMYETYRAVPLGTDFESFVDWLSASAWARSRAGHDTVLDDDDYDAAVLPVLRTLALDRSWRARFDAIGPTAGVLEALISVRPDAPGPLLAIASRRGTSDGIRELDAVRRALTAFPSFTAAHVALANLSDELGDEHAALRSLADALRCPLSYTGDPYMPTLGDVPVVEPATIAERVATHAMASELVIPGPLWELIAADDPTSPEAWLGTAVDLANEGELTLAVTAAANAAYLGVSRPGEIPAASLLAELYDALDAPWHRALAEAQAH